MAYRPPVSNGAFAHADRLRVWPGRALLAITSWPGDSTAQTAPGDWYRRESDVDVVRHEAHSKPGSDSRVTGRLPLHEINGSVVVAVVAVRMMEATVYQVVDVIPMRNCLMAAAGAVNMSRLVA